MAEKPNLYIGLICAAGTDLCDIKQQLQAQLAVVGYKYREIKVSAAIAEALDIEAPEDEYDRMITLMSAGDKVRENSEEGSGVASLIVTAIRASRPEGDDQDTSTAYVIDSLKNPKEVELLDQLYGRNFYSVSVYSSQDARALYLANKIARSKRQALDQSHFDLAQDLILKDQKGESDTGQSVRDTFPKADFFVEASKDQSSISRFIRLVFQDPFITPTLDEYMMFVAKATALRSCDLSRQVGAVISDRSGAVVATGCNEVPFPGGGFFFEGRPGSIGDNRDKEEQHDPNFNEVKLAISEFIKILKDTDHLVENLEPDVAAEALLHGRYQGVTKDSRLRNLIEFSRVVHAEMQAITQAAQLGRSLDGSTLYCTTYPCHLCARHIISAGIDAVVYIEPYPKSLTASLYHREIVSEPNASEVAPDDERVLFRSFRGISPTLYQRVFSYRKRKDSYGAIAKWLPADALPVGAVANAARPEFELVVANRIAPVLELIHKGENAEEGAAEHGGNITESTNPTR